MYTVHMVSELTGISVRTLHHYDALGLLPPTEKTAAGYRLYDDNALERLQQILLFKELEFSLKEIQAILDSPDFDQGKALDQQIRLLELRKERLAGLIELARSIRTSKGDEMAFEAFDTKQIDAYAAEAKAAWGKTDAYKEYEKKAAGRAASDEQDIAASMMDIFRRFGEIKDTAPGSPEAIALARELQDFITQHYYTCTDEIFLSLGTMYAAGGEFTANIDAAGGEGAAQFACNAIHAMVEQQQATR